MEKISAKEFFTVMWRGVCQVFGWVAGLFGYKRDGKFGKCVWRLFAVSVAVIVAIVAVALVASVGGDIYQKCYGKYHCYDSDCYYSEYISQNVYFHNTFDGKGYVFNSQTGRKTVKGVEWIVEPQDDDSLVCFSNGKKRGYFSKKTGELVIEPTYTHAWMFSEGLAGVEENGFIKFIDATGKVVIDNGLVYEEDYDYVFHGGYCKLTPDGGEHYGLMDKTGKVALPAIYDQVCLCEDEDLWTVEKEGEEGVFDMDMKPVVPLMECSIYIAEGTIDVTMPDHTMRKYDLEGQLINDFYIASVRMMEYEKEEILYRRDSSETDGDDGDVYCDESEETFHPKSTARLRAYVAGDGYEGLMSADGHVVTMPLYKNIEAIGFDLYLCEVSNSDKVIVNGKGEIVR